jgi:hypothetical protein
MSRPSGHRYVALVAIAAASVGLAGLPSAAAAKVPNVCHITGITKAKAKKVMPGLGSIANVATETTTPPNIGAFCELIPKSIDKAALEVELWDASYFQQQVTAFTSGFKTQSLRHLGKGAVYGWPSGQKHNGNLLFKRGKYTVLIDTNSAGGPASAFPPMSVWLALAHDVYKHL